MLQASPEIFVSRFHIAVLAANFKGFPDVVHGQHGLCHGHEQQGHNLIPGVGFLLRSGHHLQLNVIADHGWGDAHIRKGFQRGIDEPGHLLQIQPHVRNLLVSRQMQGIQGALDVRLNCSLNAFVLFVFLLCHHFLLFRIPGIHCIANINNRQ